MELEKTGKMELDKTGKTRYRENPFKRDVVRELQSGVRTVYASPTQSGTFAAVSRETGEDFGDISFGRKVQVEKNQFLRLYADGVKMFLGISSAGVKVFMLIFDNLLDNENWQTDMIDLAYPLLTDEQKENLSEGTFFRGIRELIKAKFLAPAMLRGRYWINANYVFRGNRLTLVNQYILDIENEDKSRPAIPATPDNVKNMEADVLDDEQA